MTIFEKIKSKYSFVEFEEKDKYASDYLSISDYIEKHDLLEGIFLYLDVAKKIYYPLKKVIITLDEDEFEPCPKCGYSFGEPKIQIGIITELKLDAMRDYTFNYEICKRTTNKDYLIRITKTLIIDE